MLSAIRQKLSANRWFRQRFYHFLYQYFAGRMDFMVEGRKFMNFGFVNSTDPKVELTSEDESDRVNIQLYEKLLRGLDLKGKKVLEVGCGRGGGTYFCIRYKDADSLTGLDLSSYNIDKCRELVGRHFSQVSYVVGDATNLPFDNSSFDVVYNLESSHCYPSIPKFIGEVYRVLKKGGHFRYADAHGISEVESVAKTIQDSRFDILGQEDISKSTTAGLDHWAEERTDVLEAVFEKKPMLKTFLRRPLENFLVTEGSEGYELIRSGKIKYFLYQLKK